MNVQGEHIPHRQTDPEVLRAAFRLAQLAKGERYVEIGSGEGRGLVIAAKEFGAEAVGVETHPDAARRSRAIAKRARASVKVIETSGQDYDVSDADVVFMYMGPAFQDEVADRLASELAPAARVVTIDFSMPGWKCVAEANLDGTNCFLYTPTAEEQCASIDQPAQTVLMSTEHPMDVFTVVRASFHRNFDRFEVEFDDELRGVVLPHHRSGSVSRGVTVPIEMEIAHQDDIPPTGLSGFASIYGHFGDQRVLCARQRWIILDFENEAGEDALMTLPGDIDLDETMLALFEGVVAGEIEAGTVAAAFRESHRTQSTSS